MKVLTIWCALLAQFLCVHETGAWSGAGHEVIAGLAYRQLPPATKSSVAEILKSHADYLQWEESFQGEVGNMDFGAYIFMRSSTWPDQIRRKGNPYDHPHWHYVDYPLRPPSFPMVNGPMPDDDVLFGIKQCEDILSNGKAAPAERAAYLSWLIHLIGDLHQPLHCASLFDEAHPAGDKGGNAFYVMPSSKGINLHSFWDGLLGTSGKPQAHLNYAIQIESQHPRKSLKELMKALTPRDWSLEGRKLAIETAYLDGRLKGSMVPAAAPLLPEGYSKKAKSIADQQAALAGYRLADEIKKCLK